jgi:hypothetical protein
VLDGIAASIGSIGDAYISHLSVAELAEDSVFPHRRSAGMMKRASL